MRLQFLGANRQVTGSCYLLDAAGLRVIVDCGIFQERRYVERNWNTFPVDPSTIDVMLLTHGHLDHCGLIPKLVREGFTGQIITTKPSTELASIIMKDSGHIHQEDAKYKAKRHRKTGRKAKFGYEPLYTVEDALKAIPQLKGYDYNEPVALNENITAQFHEAGHILGSSMIELTVNENGQTRRIIFSGDIGQWDKPLIKDPTLFDQADYLIMESTYGDRDHKDEGDPVERLGDAINEAHRNGGNVIIPTFAIERAQELMYYMVQLRMEKKIPAIPVFLDSPMAVNVTDVFRHYKNWLDDETHEILEKNPAPLQYYGLQLCRTVAQSKSINAIRGTAVIMAGSGMCTGGRIKHHLVHNISDPNSVILFVGYQSPGTLGGLMVRGKNPIRIHGREHTVRAKVAQVHGMSAHADRTDLLRWAGSLNNTPRHVFITHGEEQSALNLADELRQQHDWTVTVPEYQQIVELD